MPLEQLDDTSRSMHFHLRMLVQQRDAYLEDIKELSQAADDLDRANQQLQAQQLKQQQQLAATAGGSPEKQQEKQHMSVELAEMKSRMRKLRQEL